MIDINDNEKCKEKYSNLRKFQNMLNNSDRTAANIWPQNSYEETLLWLILPDYDTYKR